VPVPGGGCAGSERQACGACDVRRYVLRNFLQLILVMLAVGTTVFLLVFLSGDPVMLMVPMNATREEIEALREALGLNQPLWVQYGRYMLRAVQGDFGVSIKAGQPAVNLVLERIPATLELGIAGMVLATVVGMAVGVVSALRRDSWIDAFGRLLALGSQAMPIFWLGLILIIIFSVKLKLLPPFGRGGIQELIMPAITMATYNIPLILRLTRSTLFEVLHQDYVRTARAKGLPERRVVLVHILRNAAIPLVTVIGMNFGRILGGAIVTETVFAWPGVGLLSIEAVFTADYPVIMASTIILVVSVVVVNFLTDLTYGVLDPRIRHS
jgi:ABC-type dipeptide/oligopeptide/nickel transport system permease component